MKQLELKHITPYLPYDVKIMILCPGHKNKTPVDRVCSINKVDLNKDPRTLTIDFSWVDGKLGGSGLGVLKGKRLILRPMSDLKNDEHSPFKVSTYGPLVNMLSENIPHTEMGVWEYEILLKHHFDVFGLIQEGLAVDINTIQ